MTETPEVDPNETEPDPPEFNRDLVPATEYGELFFDGRTGRGLTDTEYDETIGRLEALAADESLDDEDREAAREMLRGIRGRG